MKKEFLLRFSLLILLPVFMLYSCKIKEKEESLPILNTAQVTDITDESAVVYYKITNYDEVLIRDHGVCWGHEANPTLTSGFKMSGYFASTGIFWCHLYGLQAGATYHLRSYASNTAGTAYGEDVTFSTSQVTVPEEVVTKPVSVFSSSKAIGGGILSGSGSATRLSRGLCWSTTPDPTVQYSVTGDTLYGIFEPVSFSGVLTDLKADTKYYVRAFAANGAGITYGNQISFTTGPYSVIADGKTYNSVTIGNQVWMTENLAVTAFNDGSMIPMVTNQGQWNTLQTPAYCWFNNEKWNVYAEGALYNWYAVNTGKLCPAGWHVPSDAEWANLKDFLGSGSAIKLSKPDLMTWTDLPGDPEKTLFWATACGTRDTITGFQETGGCGIPLDYHWWSSTPSGNWAALSSWLYESELSSHAEFSRRNGYSIRCIKD